MKQQLFTSILASALFVGKAQTLLPLPTLMRPEPEPQRYAGGFVAGYAGAAAFQRGIYELPFRE